MARLMNLQSTEITFISEISEDTLVMLNDDIYCSFDKPSRVGAGDTASVFPRDDIVHLFDRSALGWIAVKVINHLGNEVMKVSWVG